MLLKPSIAGEHQDPFVEGGINWHGRHRGARWGLCPADSGAESAFSTHDIFAF